MLFSEATKAYAGELPRPTSDKSAPKPGPETMTDSVTCCTPTSGPSPMKQNGAPLQGERRIAPHAVDIPGGPSLLGTDRPELPDDSEGPLRQSKLKPFKIGATAVTNDGFSTFIAATGYVTDAERFGWSFVFWSDAAADTPDTSAVAGAEWWRRMDGACWNRVNGKEAPAPDHPVVHVS